MSDNKQKQLERAPTCSHGSCGSSVTCETSAFLSALEKLTKFKVIEEVHTDRKTDQSISTKAESLKGLFL